MNDLQKKLELIEQLQSLGIGINPDDLARLKREQEFNHIVKFCAQHFTALNNISAKLSEPVRVIIDFDPEEEIQIGFTEIPEDDELTAPISVDSLPKSKVAKKLRVITPDGEEWTAKYGYEVLVRFINTVGPDKVAELNIEARPNIPLVSKNPDFELESWRELDNGWYAYTHTSTRKKLRQILKISKAYNLGYKANYAKEKA